MRPGDAARARASSTSPRCWASPPPGCRRRRTPRRKAGLIGLTRDLAQQWTGRKGIRVNAIAPGFFASEMTEQYPPGYLESQQARGSRPAARATRAELAATVVFLASDAAGYITGQTLPVDGGMTIT